MSGLARNPAYQRAMILQQQRRYADAERELRQALASDPHEAELHAMLALCLLEQKQLREATDEAQQAVGLAPDLAFAHYALSRVWMDRQRPADAVASVTEAIRLDAFNPHYWSMLAAIRFEQRGWPGALEAAERGLQIDPDHAGCQNLRAMALVKLGRRDEAGQTIGEALRNNPENALTHANEGWRLLHANQPKEAMRHFREALRLDPQLDWARAGIVEALKAHNFLYRWMLIYFLWMARLSRQVQWAIIVGGYFGFRYLHRIAETNPAAGKWIWPVLYAYIAFAALTWLADPLFNLMLRLHPFGKHALSDTQKMTANIVGVLITLALAFVVAWLVRDDERMAAVAIVLATLMIPSAAIFRCAMSWPRIAMASIAGGLALLGLLGLAVMFTIESYSGTAREDCSNLFKNILQFYTLGIVGSQFAANYLMSVTPRR